jgi:hypothetical protein
MPLKFMKLSIGFLFFILENKSQTNKNQITGYNNDYIQRNH